MTLHRDERAFTRDDFIVAELTINEFLVFLRKQFRAVIDKKADSMFFNSCVFDPPAGAQGFRRKNYFKKSSFMVLDFDDGNLSPEEFERIFWCQAGRGQKRSFVICNSFSRCALTPNKFRVILFYKRPAATLQQHEAVFDGIVSRLEANGYTPESAKIDAVCRSGNQSFYLPCTNRAHQDWAFFRAYGTKTRDLERCAIDPVLYGKTAVLRLPAPKSATVSNIVPSVSRVGIDEVTAHLRSLKTGRHRAVFDAAMRLRRLGLSKREVEAELLLTVGHERRMRKKVSDALKSLTKYRWFSGHERRATCHLSSVTQVDKPHANIPRRTS